MDSLQEFCELQGIKVEPPPQPQLSQQLPQLQQQQFFEAENSGERQQQFYGQNSSAAATSDPFQNSRSHLQQPQQLIGGPAIKAEPFEATDQMTAGTAGGSAASAGSPSTDNPVLKQFLEDNTFQVKMAFQVNLAAT